MTDVTTIRILTTGPNFLFTGGREGKFQALDAGSGELLWRTSLGGQIANGPITYAVDGTQYVAAAAGNGFFVFALKESGRTGDVIPSVEAGRSVRWSRCFAIQRARFACGPCTRWPAKAARMVQTRSMPSHFCWSESRRMRASWCAVKRSPCWRTTEPLIRWYFRSLSKSQQKKMTESCASMSMKDCSAMHKPDSARDRTRGES